MVPNDTTGRRIKTADKVFDIIEYVRANEGAELPAIADHVNIAKSTTHAYLGTLKDRGYLTRDGDEYRLSIKFLNHGTHVRHTYSIFDLISPLLRELANKTEGLVEFTILEDGHEVPLELVRGPRAVRTVDRIGVSYPAHATAAGKAMLSQLSESEVEAIIDEHGLTPETEHTITDRAELFEELDAIRERGYAYNDSELVDDIRAVATPINAEEYNQMAVVVAGLGEWMRGTRYREEIPQAILEVKNEVELKYKYDS